MKIQIGTHALMVGDITTDAVSQLMGAELADVLYSDPPWGPGNQQYWHTMRERYVARQQCRQLVCNDYENNLAVNNKPDPRDELIAYYEETL